MGHAELTLHDQAAARQISLDEYWMPFTPNGNSRSIRRWSVRAEGMYYWNDRGDKLIDASSGLFCCAAGHGRKEIADAVARSCGARFIAPFTRGHPKQFELATRIAELTPGDLNRMFFVNSGSEAVDTAMKVALAYHQARGQGGRHMFVSRERAYHGVGFGGVALSGMVNNRRKFGVRRCPASRTCAIRIITQNLFTQGEGAHGAELAEDLQRMVTLYGAENIAACFVEPIAGSTGCLVPPKGYLKRLREICESARLLLVFDEVIYRGRPHGPGVRRAELRRHAGHHHDGEGDHQRRAADGGGGHLRAHPRHHHGRGGRRHDRVLPRLHVFRTPGAVRRRHRHARHLQERGPVREGAGAVAVFPRRDLLAQGRRRGHRHPRLRHDGRHRRRAAGHARRARPPVPEEALRRRPAPQDDGRLRDTRAAADRREGASTRSPRSCARHCAPCSIARGSERTIDPSPVRRHR